MWDALSPRGEGTLLCRLRVEAEEPPSRLTLGLAKWQPPHTLNHLKQRVGNELIN